jgi:plasmid stabilization system protein ParE
MARLTITESARADLREIRAYIAKDNPAAARRVVERLRAQARKLAATPASAGAARICGPICSPFRSASMCSSTARNRAGSCSGSFTAPATCRRSSASPSPSSCGLPGPCRQNLVSGIRIACYPQGHDRPRPAEPFRRPPPDPDASEPRAAAADPFGGRDRGPTTRVRSSSSIRCSARPACLTGIRGQACMNGV